MGYGPTLNQGGDIQCDHDAGFVREYLVNDVGDNVDTKGKGRREPLFLLVKTRQTNWQSSRPGGYRDVINNGNKGLLTR